jgi:N-acyl-phosphatidylethanolamine-hydrolysing phospholipase D
MRTRALRTVVLAIGVALSVLTSGCRIGRAGVRAAGSFFDSPRPVNKGRAPVRKDARLAVLWIGHATVLVQMDDKLVLTDPVFTSSVGQLARRVVEPGLDPEHLPPVDAVLVSHMHFDHLSLGSLDTIESKVKTLLLPHGGTTYLTDFSFPAYELRTWQAWEKDGLRVTATPVDHVGFRYGIDDAWMKEAFTGYVIEYHGLKVYFGGDSAYRQEFFVETAQRFPGIDLALLPIAPIEPRNIMRLFHMDPREALQAFVDLDATRMVPIHYDTFINSTDNPGDALRELDAAQKKANLQSWRQVAPIAVGEQKVFVKVGEDPKPKAKKLPPPSPATPPPAPKPPAKNEKNEKKNEIPEEDRLD